MITFTPEVQFGPTTYRNDFLRIHLTPERAVNIVETCLKSCTQDQKFAIAAALLNVPLLKMRFASHVFGSRQRGGESAHFQHDPWDRRIYNLLIAVEIYHDFKDSEAATLVEIPSELTLDDLLDEKQFIRQISRFSHLTFGSDVVENPFHDADMSIEGNALSHGGNVLRLFRNFQETRKWGDVVPLEIWTCIGQESESSAKLEYIKLYQLARLIGIVNSLDVNDIIMDAPIDDFMTLVMTNITLMKTAMLKAICFISGESRYEEIPDKNVFARTVRQIMNKIRYQHRDLNVHICDASIFDAGQHKMIPGISLDSSPTGAVFRDDSPYHIQLQGVHNEVTPKGHQTVVRFSLHEKHMTYTGEHSSADTTAAFSINAIKGSRGHHVALAKKRDEFSPAFRYAMKRAGDWGQVEHCKKYGKMFVTQDLMAVFYAVYRGVPCIYLQYEEKEGIPDDVDSGFMELENCFFWRYRFVIWQNKK